MMPHMAKKPEPAKPAQTAFDKFTEASRELFNLPQHIVRETVAKYPTLKSKKKTKK
jgi:hypothetical protein